MTYKVEDLNDETKFRQILTLHYNDLIKFVFDYLKKKSPIMIFFWMSCIIFFGVAAVIRINISGGFPSLNIFFHSLLGLILFPLLSVVLHELLHIIPYYLSGARNIRIGMDLKQYLFYVTAHRYVASMPQFIIVALVPFLSISIATVVSLTMLPGLWKWSFSLFLAAHATMCAGDFALLNFYYPNRDKKIYTWDDADKKIAYFYEKI